MYSGQHLISPCQRLGAPVLETFLKRLLCFQISECEYSRQHVYIITKTLRFLEKRSSRTLVGKMLFPLLARDPFTLFFEHKSGLHIRTVFETVRRDRVSYKEKHIILLHFCKSCGRFSSPTSMYLLCTRFNRQFSRFKAESINKKLILAHFQLQVFEAFFHDLCNALQTVWLSKRGSDYAHFFEKHMRAGQICLDSAAKKSAFHKVKLHCLKQRGTQNFWYIPQICVQK